MDESGLRERDCKSCEKADREFLNCENRLDGLPVEITYDKEIFDLSCCPLAWVRDHSTELSIMPYFNLFSEKNLLPKPGGLDNQPTAIMEGFRILSGEIRRLENKKFRRLKAEAEKHGK